MERKQFVIIGIAIALVIAVAAPFLASGDPDGLESAFFSIYGAKPFMGSELDEDAAGAAEEQVVAATGNDFSYEALMPDYSIPGMDKAGEVACGRYRHASHAGAGARCCEDLHTAR